MKLKPMYVLTGSYNEVVHASWRTAVDSGDWQSPREATWLHAELLENASSTKKVNFGAIQR